MENLIVRVVNLNDIKVFYSKTNLIDNDIVIKVDNFQEVFILVNGKL